VQERILFCYHCGKILSGEAFANGGAYIVQDRPYCSPCRPPERVTDRRTPHPVEIEQPGTKLIPVVKALGTPTVLLILGALAAAGAVVALIRTAVGTARHVGGPQDPAAPPVAAPSTAPPALTPEEAERRIRDLERRAAASSDPDEVLRWCEEARPLLQDTTFETRRRGVEIQAREEKARRAPGVEPLLAELRKALAERPIEGRRTDVEHLLAAALQVAGSRREEVAALKAEYDGKVEEAARRAGLVGRWTFDEPSGEAAVDASGRGHHARVGAGALRAPGRSGGALRFDDRSSPVELPGVPDLDFASDGSFTLSAWYWPETRPPQAAHGILVRGDPPLGLRYSADGRFEFKHALEGDLEASATAPDAVPPRHWYHVAGVVDLTAGSSRIYLNGHPQRAAFWAPGTRARAPEGARWRVGVGANGTVDEVRVYRRALSAEEVRALYTEVTK